MTEQSSQPQNSPAEDEHPEVYSINQDKDGIFHLSRRDFLYVSAAGGGALLLRMACPRFGTKAAPSEPAQAGIGSLPRVYLHAEPSIASNIAGTLQHNDFVRLINDRPDLDWVEVVTQSEQHGWIKRELVDFSQAIRSYSPNFDLSSTLTPTPAQANPHLTCSVRSSNGENNPMNVLEAAQDQSCGEVILNGDFEAGSIYWSEESTGYIIRDDYDWGSGPHQGSWVAWFGGEDATERLTQLFHVPARVKDAQRLYFYLEVLSYETAIAVHDRFSMRFLDGSGNPLTPDVPIANDTDRGYWTQYYVDITGMTSVADTDIQIQFKGVYDAANVTSFALDMVSLDMACEPLNYIYLPIVVKPAVPDPTATLAPTETPIPTPIPTNTPCPGHDPCPFDCGYDCGSDCTYDCSSDCTFDCIYDCTFDCIYHCAYD